MGWVRLVARVGKGRGACMVFVGKLEEKRQLG